MTRVVVSPTSVAMFPEGGGHFWVFLQWVRGFQRCGCDVWWLECLDRHYDRVPDQRVVDRFLENLASIGLSHRVLIYQVDASGRPVFMNVDDSVAWGVIEQADVLVNFRYGVNKELVGRARRSALIDIDPGLLQFWVSHGQLSIAPHDLYFTTGEHIGSDRVPDCDLAWHCIRPVVDTESWPVAGGPSRPELTTVTNWFGEWLTDGGQFLMDNSKRVEFLRIVDLPRHTAQPLELAVCFGDNAEDVADRAKLEAGGWRIRHAFDVSRDPRTYQLYIQSSRGEFSCVKPSCLMFQNAWISDRTLCYLSSGRPAIVQHTGPSAYLPDSEGLFRFRTASEALHAIEMLNERYEVHRQAARQLAETYFDARLNALSVLETALGS